MPVPGQSTPIPATVGKPPARPVKLNWLTKTVVVESDIGAKVRQTARYLGSLAVHQHTDKPSLWQVTHIGTGRRICSLAKEEDALTVAATLYLKYRKEFSVTTLEGVKAAVPQRVVYWILDTNKALRPWGECP